MQPISANTELVPQNCVIYVRVSSDEQVTNYSLQTQEEYCRKEAERQNLDVLRVFKDEGFSAKSLKRPALFELLTFCQKNNRKISTLLVYKLDRLSRETSDYLALRRRLADIGIKIASTQEPLGDSAVDKFFETVLASIGQLDNNLKSERTKAGLRARFLDGWFSGKPPLGYTTKSQNGRQIIVKDPKTFDTMKKAWELMGTGHKSLKEMATVMDNWGLKASWKGKPWPLRPQTVDRMFRNRFYAGVLISNASPEEVQGKHPVMITEELYYKVQGIINGNRQNSNMKRIRDNTDFPLRGLINCDCGFKYTAAFCKGRNKKYPLYWCPNPKHKSTSFAAEKLEEDFVKFLRQITPSAKTTDLFLTILKRKYYQKLGKLEARKRRSDIELAELKEMRKTLGYKHLKGEYDDEMFNEMKQTISDNILAVQIIRDEALIDKYDIEAIVNFAKSLFSDLGKAYLVGDLAQRRILIGSIFPENVVLSEQGFLNRSISPLFQAIRASSDPHFALRVADGT